MPKFRKKPVVIEAMQFRGPDIINIDYKLQLDYALEFDDWIVAKQKNQQCRYVGSTLIISHSKGYFEAQPGDWIICGTRGELYSCEPDIFAMTYEEIE